MECPQTLYQHCRKLLPKLKIYLNSSMTRKRTKPSDYPDVEKALLTWLKQARCQSVPLCGPILEQKARRLAEMLGHDEFVDSNAGLQRFKGRHSVTFRTINGEAQCIQNT